MWRCWIRLLCELTCCVVHVFLSRLSWMFVCFFLCSFGNIRLLGVCCPLLKILHLHCTAWGFLLPTMWWPSLASGTSSPSWGRWRKLRERQSTVVWYERAVFSRHEVHGQGSGVVFDSECCFVSCSGSWEIPPQGEELWHLAALRLPQWNP